jgi:hypothetical protein
VVSHIKDITIKNSKIKVEPFKANNQAVFNIITKP